MERAARIALADRDEAREAIEGDALRSAGRILRDRLFRGAYSSSVIVAVDGLMSVASNPAMRPFAS